MQSHPDVSVRLDLTDRVVDLLNEGVDCAVRIGEMADSSLASSKLGEMRRVVVASPVSTASAPAGNVSSSCTLRRSLGAIRVRLTRNSSPTFALVTLGHFGPSRQLARV